MVTCASHRRAVNQSFPTTATPDTHARFDYLLEQLTELRGTFTYIYRFIVKCIFINDPEGQPNEEIQRARSGKVLSSGALFFVDLGYATPSLYMDAFISPEAYQILFKSFYGT